MKSILHKAATRGHADHGWLKSKHTFSFADYYDPERMNFGTLRVLNDDWIAGGTGFGRHAHNNMEIISIPIEGALEHGDSMGNTGVIRKGQVQVMSAGTGVMHSEMNANEDEAAQFLQIWVLPKVRDVEPRYADVYIADQAKPNDFQQIVSPNAGEDGVWIHQDAWFHLAVFEKGFAKKYTLKNPANGVYIFVIKGRAKIGEQVLDERDGYGLWELDSFELEALEDSEILVMEVPL
jgi:redox-sensitive bicupin YhaK (pirin superfamily)